MELFKWGLYLRGYVWLQADRPDNNVVVVKSCGEIYIFNKSALGIKRMVGDDYS
jgi:hypothetical protein